MENKLEVNEANHELIEKFTAIIRNEVVDLREKNNIQQKEMAKRLRLSQSTLSRYETGDRCFSVDIFCGYCAELDLNPVELFKEAIERTMEEFM